MKKLLCLILVIAICIPLYACGDISEMIGDYVGDFVDTIRGEEKSRDDDEKENDKGSDREEMMGENPFRQPEEEVPAAALPKFEQKSISYAEAWLEEAGIEARIEYAYTSDYPEGTVIYQSIPAGTLPSDDVLMLTVSKTPAACPYEYSQKLTVSASSGSSYATATLYEWADGDWQQLASYNARVGKNGIGPAAEGSLRSPMGTHKLGIVLSANAVNTNMPTRVVSASTCVVDDKNSPYYNIIMEKSQVPNGTSSDPIGNGLTNGTTYATIYIEHNGSGLSADNVVPGKGSAIGLRGQYGALGVTYGDVDISYSDMVDLLSRLDVNRKPVIEIVLE